MNILTLLFALLIPLITEALAADSDFNSVFITGKQNTSVEGTKFKWGSNARHLYSKVQPWSCDGRWLWLANRGMPGEQLFLHNKGVDSKKSWVAKDIPGTELRWLPHVPETMLYVNQSELGLWHVGTEEKKMLLRLHDLKDLAIGPYEGNISNSGEKVVVTGSDVKDSALRVSVLVDIKQGQELSRWKHPEFTNLDWISVSASGKYIVVHGNLTGTNGDQTQVLDQLFQPIGELWLDYGLPSHYDLTLDARGDDVAVGVAKSGPMEGQVIMRRLSDGKVTALIASGYASHTSARNYLLPGWVFVTYQGELASYPPFHDEIIAVPLNASGDVIRIAQFPTPDDRYWAQPQAVPSPDGTEVLWAQLWGGEQFNKSNADIDKKEHPIGAALGSVEITSIRNASCKPASGL